MAEALAVAASGIAVAQITIQVGSAVVKLRRLWGEIKDVPDDITDLMDQIDCLDPVLLGAENGFNQGDLPSSVWDSLASKPATTYCRKALQDLTTMVDELNTQISNAKRGRRKLTAVKVLLKKDTLKRLEKRLENAVKMLLLAQQSYLVALTRVQPDIIIQRFTALTVRDNQSQLRLTPESESEPEESAVSNSLLKQPGKNTAVALPCRIRRSAFTGRSIFGKVLVESSATGHAILLQAPTWLSQRSWELHSTKAYGDWQWNIRTYSTVPRDSKVMELAGNGSPEDLQRLFNAGLASPYDRDPIGRTLLNRASIKGNFRTVRYLIDIGLRSMGKTYILPEWGTRSLASISPFFFPQDSFQTFAEQVLSFPTVAAELHFYFESENEDVQQPTSECQCRHGTFDVRWYNALLPYQCPQHQNTSLESRLEAAAYALGFYARPEVIRQIIGPEWSVQPQTVLSNKIQILILPTACAFCFHIQDYSSWYRRRTEVPENIDLARHMFTLLVEAIRHNPDIHPTDVLAGRSYLYDDRDSPLPRSRLELYARTWLYGRTATEQLAIDVARQLVRKRTTYFLDDLSSALKPWIEALGAAGVDLVTYGQREHDLLIKNDFLDDMKADGWPWEWSVQVTYRLVGFKFGPAPQDWEFYWAEPTDEFAGDFWKLIEDPPLRVPGSWVD